MVSLKCGHLFGDSCVKRWLNDQVITANKRFCPVCRTKAEPKHIRPLYARRIVQIKYERLNELKSELSRYKERATKFEALYNRERTRNSEILRQAGMHCGPSTSSTARVIMPIPPLSVPNQQQPPQLTTVRVATHGAISVPTSSRHTLNPPPFSVYPAPTASRTVVNPNYLQMVFRDEFQVHDFSQVPDQRTINNR